jgi:rare lipoprotein A
MLKIIPKGLFWLSLSLSTFFANTCLAAEEGIAAYYSDVFHGKKTASGKIYNKNGLTGAHKTLPFDTIVRVTDLTNNKSVVVTITDRGPYSEKRIIDLSRAAAIEIDLIQRGIGPVRLEIIDEQKPMH